MATQAAAMNGQLNDQQEVSGDQDDKKNSKFKCRVDGCKRHLSREKTYFRRYRCCMTHSKQPAVLVEGQVRRWCQQCCCFHELSAFDGEKRNCRERLAMHNDRRNKRKHDPAATRQPSSRVASAAPTPATPTHAQHQRRHQHQHQQQQPEHSQQPQPGRRAAGAEPGSSAGGKVARTSTSLQSALSGLDALQGGHGGSSNGKRQRLASHHPQQQQQAAGPHSALMSMLEGGGGGGGGLTHPALFSPALLDPRQPAQPGPSPHQAYQDALAAMAAAQALQEPAAAAAVAHRTAASQSALLHQLAAAQAAAASNPFGNPQVLSASSASAGGGSESPGALAAYLQAFQAQQRQQQQQAALHAALLSQSLQNPQPQQQVRAAVTPPAFGHLLAAGRQLSLGSGYRPGAAATAAPRSALAGLPTGLSAGPFPAGSPTARPLTSAGPLLGRRSSGATDQQSDMSMWSRRSSNTATDAGLFLPPGAATSLAAAAAAADNSLRTASVTTLPKPSSSPLKGPHTATAAVAAAVADASQHGQMLKVEPELPGGGANAALPVQGHYGAMQKTGGESTYLHTQLLQAQQAAARQGAPPLQGGDKPTNGSTSQKAEAAAAMRATAASDIRAALQAVQWQPAAELGSRVWWRRRLGSLTLLVHMGTGCMPRALCQGLLALTEMSLRLARAATISE